MTELTGKDVQHLKLWKVLSSDMIHNGFQYQIGRNDLLEKWKIQVILVSQNYLGSINHTLLSYDLLNSRKIPILGIVFNGPENKSSEDYILNYTKLTCLARIPELKIIDGDVIKTLASKINLDLFR